MKSRTKLVPSTSVRQQCVASFTSASGARQNDLKRWFSHSLSYDWSLKSATIISNFSLLTARRMRSNSREKNIEVHEPTHSEKAEKQPSENCSTS